jgi:hypothetical protein
MTRAALLATLACVCGCVTSASDHVHAAPGETAEPGFAQPEAGEPTARSDSEAAIGSIAAPGSPAAEPAAASGDRWTYSLTPYVWAGGMRSATTLEGGSQHARETLGGLVSDFEFALMAHAEARRGRFFAFGEVVWADVTADIAGARRASGKFPTVDGEVDVAQVLAMLAAGWRFLEVPLDCNDRSKLLALELYGAVRYSAARVDVDAARTPAGGPTRQFDADSSVDWWDPLLGVRVRAGVVHALDLLARAEYGGFGVGSERTALLMAGFDWMLAGSTSLEAGWAVSAFRYQEGSGRGRFALTEKMSGPYLALTLRF